MATISFIAFNLFSSHSDLKRNNITLLARDNFKGQKYLEELDLSHNKIDILTSGLFEYLEVGYKSSWIFFTQPHSESNRIAKKEISIHFMQGLQRLDLSNNKIQKLVVRLFYSLRKLKHLDLSGNPVGELKPEIFQDLPVRYYP